MVNKYRETVMLCSGKPIHLMLLSAYVTYMICDINYTVILSQQIRDVCWFDDRTASQTVSQHCVNNWHNIIAVVAYWPLSHTLHGLENAKHSANVGLPSAMVPQP